MGQTEDLGIPKFLPWLPKPQQARLEAIVEREITKWVRRAERAPKRRRSDSKAGDVRGEFGDGGLHIGDTRNPLEQIARELHTGGADNLASY